MGDYRDIHFRTGAAMLAGDRIDLYLKSERRVEDKNESYYEKKYKQ